MAGARARPQGYKVIRLGGIMQIDELTTRLSGARRFPVMRELRTHLYSGHVSRPDA